MSQFCCWWCSQGKWREECTDISRQKQTWFQPKENLILSTSCYLLDVHSGPPCTSLLVISKATKAGSLLENGTTSGTFRPTKNLHSSTIGLFRHIFISRFLYKDYFFATTLQLLKFLIIINK